MRRILVLLIPIMLTACGGGNAGYGPVSWYCNSAESSDWIDNGVVVHSSPTFIEQLNALGSTRNIDHCRNGLQLGELLAGSPVAMDVPPGPPVPSLAEQLKHDPAPVIVIAMGEVEAIFTDQKPPEHLDLLEQAVRIVRAAGKTPQIAGLVQFAPTEIVTTERLERVKQFDDVRRSFATLNHLTFYDHRAVPFYGADDQRPDHLHPGPEYRQRLAGADAAMQRAARVPAY